MQEHWTEVKQLQGEWNSYDMDCPGCGVAAWKLFVKTPFTSIRMECVCGVSIRRTVLKLRGSDDNAS